MIKCALCGFCTNKWNGHIPGWFPLRVHYTTVQTNVCFSEFHKIKLSSIRKGNDKHNFSSGSPPSAFLPS